MQSCVDSLQPGEGGAVLASQYRGLHSNCFVTCIPQAFPGSQTFPAQYPMMDVTFIFQNIKTSLSLAQSILTQYWVQIHVLPFGLVEGDPSLGT